MENNNGAKIYKGFMNHFPIKVESHLSNFDPLTWVDYQGDIYMGMDGLVYLIVENSEIIDTLGNVVPKEVLFGYKGQPMLLLIKFYMD